MKTEVVAKPVQRRCEEEKDPEFDFYIDEGQQQVAEVVKNVPLVSEVTQLNPIKIISLFSELCNGQKVSEFLLKHS